MKAGERTSDALYNYIIIRHCHKPEPKPKTGPDFWPVWGSQTEAHKEHLSQTVLPTSGVQLKGGLFAWHWQLNWKGLVRTILRSILNLSPVTSRLTSLNTLD